MKSLFIVTITLISHLVSHLSFAAGMDKPVEQNAQYRVSFIANWTSDELPVDFPSNPHFSPLVGASHDGAYGLFQLGSSSTDGLRDVAETGSTTQLLRELRRAQNQNQVLNYRTGNGIPNGTGRSSVVLEVSREHSLLSAATMIAPSPDWIVGFNSLRTIENGNFINRIQIPAYAIDAGTDAGRSFSSPNRRESRRKAIKILTEDELFIQDDRLVPFGSFVIEKI